MQPALRPGMQQDPNKPAPNPQPQSVQDHADQVLQQQLLAAQYDNAQNVPHPPRPQPGVPAHHLHAARDPNANIDPAISGAAPPPGGMIPAPSDLPGGGGADAQQQHPHHPQHPHPHAHAHAQQQQPGQPQPPDSPEARKTYGKRELSSSKRAAQNRAAQRAFRQRKEGYIRKLEEQVKDYDNLTDACKAIQTENYQLRDYIITLQNRLVETQNDVPELPAGVDLSQPRPDPTATAPGSGPGPGPLAPGPQGGAGGAGSAGLGGSEQPEQLNALNRIAVAGLGMRKHQHEEAAYLGGPNPTVGGGGMPAKRPRTEGGVDEGGEADSSQVSKDEGSSLPALTTS